MISTSTTKRGFTIVELLIVIVVIAILAVIAIVAYNGIQQRARASAASNDLAQAKKKLELYKVDNGSYPTTGNLSAAGVADGTTTYQYTSDSLTYCLTGTNVNVSYKVTDTSSPASGGCAGHGQGGVAAVTNLYLNPSFESTTTSVQLYNGSTISRVSVGDAASGSYIARITRGTAGSGLLAMFYPTSWSANSPVSVRFKVRLSPGSTATNTLSTGGPVQTYNSGTGVGAATGCTTSITPSTLSTSSWSDVVIQGCTTPNVTMNTIGVRLLPAQSWLATDGIEVDAVMLVNASTIPSFADGNSANWIWNGTVNNSTSTGPAL